MRLAPLVSLLAVASARVVARDQLTFVADADKYPAGVHATDSFSWTDCGQKTDAVTINSITLNPDPPKAGHNLTVTVKATANEEIGEGATADLTFRLGKIAIKRKTIDLCEEARSRDLSIRCPVSKGEHTVVETFELPRELPPGKYRIEVRAFTADDTNLACLDLAVDWVRARAGGGGADSQDIPRQ
ncbi:hypothetical protein Q8F55_000646 [Vanrija albida]|uniref:Phosphatidylglycerol/phosphatidylinositol transfer protein n=1 Tax=Vanrija albida TaxID=181172 RepID=A0ABR3QEG0_9TREE